MPHGKCKKCGADYYGWSLLSKPQENECLYCGGKIEVINDGTKQATDRDNGSGSNRKTGEYAGKTG